MGKTIAPRNALSLMLFGTTIFLSAFLLFQVQPLIAKHILPIFGGSPGVWTVCMLFFQTLLLFGYAYAHYLDSYLTLRKQALTHLVISLLALLWLPIISDGEVFAADPLKPTLHILLILTFAVGLPYFVLCSTGILFQAWFRELHRQHSPYPLYAVSNFGSLLALFSYPLIMEVWWSTPTQGKIWSTGFLLYVVLGAVIALRVRIHATGDNPVPIRHMKDGSQSDITGGSNLLWLVFPALGTMLLLSVTNQLTQDVAVVPYLWLLPLGLYLLSFILCFERDRWYWRPFWWGLFFPALAAVGYTLIPGVEISLPRLLLIYHLFFFVSVMICHGELVRTRPESTGMTRFYLFIATGGALGGVFVAIVAPLIFNDYLELHTSLALIYLIAPLALFRDRSSWLYGGRPRWAWGVFMAGGVLLGVLLYSNYAFHTSIYTEVTRSFFGVLRVSENTTDGSRLLRKLIHGNTLHGMQYLDGVGKTTPTAYYTELSGIGQVMSLTHKPAQPRNIGIVGLGAGTLAYYGREGERFRFYEINPDVIHIANRFFSFLSEAKANVEVVTGDARQMLENEDHNSFDILVLDAFSSDAIPVHLLTQEAFAIYDRHLKPSGVLSLHITNRHLDLRPLILTHAQTFGFGSTTIHSEPDTEFGRFGSDWMILSRDLELLSRLKGAQTENPPLLLHPWTDTRSDIFTLLK